MSVPNIFAFLLFRLLAHFPINISVRKLIVHFLQHIEMIIGTIIMRDSIVSCSVMEKRLLIPRACHFRCKKIIDRLT